MNAKVTIAFSKEMENLRIVQTELNHFLWTSEISYGYILSELPKHFPDKTTLAVDALGHVTTEAWYPTNQGRIKFGDSTGRVLEQVSANTALIYRAVLVFFYSAFEHYLEERIRPLKPHSKNKQWGPFYESLALDCLFQSKTPLLLHSVLCADLCRVIRNRMVHPPFDVPAKISHPEIQKWKVGAKHRLTCLGWDGAKDEIIEKALFQVVGKASHAVREAAKGGKTLPIELFYTLFTFTNLDTVAFEIEEALIPTAIKPEGRGARKKEYVRRTDLIIEGNVDPK
jgi:hypothetical protein